MSEEAPPLSGKGVVIRCSWCKREQRLDLGSVYVLREVDVLDAGDVFLRCNDWSNCGETFRASCPVTGEIWCRPVTQFESASLELGLSYARANRMMAELRAACRHVICRFGQLEGFGYETVAV